MQFDEHNGIIIDLLFSEFDNSKKKRKFEFEMNLLGKNVPMNLWSLNKKNRILKMFSRKFGI